MHGVRSTALLSYGERAARLMSDSELGAWGEGLKPLELNLPSPASAKFALLTKPARPLPMGEGRTQRASASTLNQRHIIVNGGTDHSRKGLYMPLDETLPPGVANMRLPEFFKKFIRRYVDAIGLYRHCPHAICGRAGRCATRDVLCYQLRREEINAVLRPIVRERLEREGILPGRGGV